ncbi:MAG: TonB family protein [Rickettsiales bacterium]
MSTVIGNKEFQQWNNIAQKTMQHFLSVSLGCLVTGMLLFFMVGLINLEVPRLNVDPVRIEPVVMDKPEPPQAIVNDEIKKPVEPVDQPVIPSYESKITDTGEVNISMRPTFDNNKKITGDGYMSGNAIAVMKVAPQYPRRMLSRGVEGFVDLIFDITPYGRTENIRVFNSEPEGVFDKAAIQALQKWKYKPATDDGVAVGQKNQQTRITFEIEE